MNLINQNKQLRNFGFLMGAVFLVLAALSWKIGGSVYGMLALLGAGFLILGWGAPLSLSLFYALWMKLAGVLQIIMTTVILAFVFYIILTPLALVARLSGKKFLDLGPEEGTHTYWKPSAQKETPENQF